METIEKVSETEIKITTTLVSEEVIPITTLAERKETLKAQIQDIQHSLDVGEQEYLTTRKSYLDKITELTEEIDKLDGQQQEAANLGVIISA